MEYPAGGEKADCISVGAPGAKGPCFRGVRRPDLIIASSSA
jgi:hypothetical protein